MSLPPHNTQSTIHFLKQLKKDIWVLTAIHPMSEKIQTKSFRPNDEEAAFKWIEKRQGKFNLYFMVNEPLRELKKKAKKTDVKEVSWLHVDVDPRAGENFDEERKRAIKVLREFNPPPTFIIDSGGGYQGFWRLERPFPIDGDLAKAEEIEALNKQIENELQGDKCHNIDRIMRLPGTINLPNKRKIAKDRKPAPAEIYIFEKERVYPLSYFTPASTKPAGENNGNPGPAIIPENLPKLSSVDDLPESVKENTKALILYGKDPENPKKYPSRSEVVFRVICELERAGVEEKIIASLLLDSKFGISSHILDQADPPAYAFRQIVSAEKAVKSSWNPVNKETGEPRRSYHNARVALLRLGISCQYDIFHNRKMIGSHILQNFQGEISDHGCTILRQVILEKFGFDPGKDHTRDAIEALCLEHSFDPVNDYLNGLKWDGKHRINSLLSKYFGADANVYTSAIGRIMLVAAVRRVRNPGVKFDNIVVLEGPQGTGKSTALSILAGHENFSDQEILTLDAKSQMEAMEGVWIYELCELEGLSKADISKVKAFASRQEERARPAYGRYRENRPRKCILVGTTNESQYLRDKSGNRRFLPIKTDKIDLDSLKRDRDQLWAEAAYLEAKGGSILLPVELWQLASQEQEERVEHDPWADKLENLKGEIFQGTERISSAYILTDVLEISKDRQGPYHSKRLAGNMRKLDWDGPKPLRIKKNQKPVRGYERVPTQRKLNLKSET